MVNTDTFIPLCWEEVSWKEEGVLHRGCVEGDVSERLYNTCKNPSPSYFGIYARYPTEEELQSFDRFISALRRMTPAPQ